MTDQVMELVQALGITGQDGDALRVVCASACRTLERRLRDGLTAEDCEGAFPLAAAWLAMDWLRDGQGLDGITALSAGDISVRREGGGDSGKLSQRAFELMASWLRDDGFVFRGVRG